jgi:hypothetical protein
MQAKQSDHARVSSGSRATRPWPFPVDWCLILPSFAGGSKFKQEKPRVDRGHVGGSQAQRTNSKWGLTAIRKPPLPQLLRDLRGWEVGHEVMEAVKLQVRHGKTDSCICARQARFTAGDMFGASDAAQATNMRLYRTTILGRLLWRRRIPLRASKSQTSSTTTRVGASRMLDTCCAYDGLHCLLGALEKGKGRESQQPKMFLN